MILAFGCDLTGVSYCRLVIVDVSQLPFFNVSTLFDLGLRSVVVISHDQLPVFICAAYLYCVNVYLRLKTASFTGYNVRNRKR